MRKANKIAMIAASLVLILAGCGNIENANLGNSNKATTSKSKSYTTTGQTNTADYQGLIKNGKYETNGARGVTSRDDSTDTNSAKSFETGLTKLSKNTFAPNKYVLQEGQYITSDTATAWISRKSKSNPNGLNPEDNGQKDAEKRNPIYLQQMVEQDYLIQDGNDKYTLGGISVGLGMNKTDYYTKEQYGATFSTSIPTDKMESEGKSMADTVVKRIRAAHKSAKNVPIMVALYEQPEQDSLVGGTYFTYGVAKAGNNKITEWHKVSQANYVLPPVDGAKSGNSSDATAFTSFKKQVQSVFPNLSGVVAQTHYENGNLAGMNITITTQFYGETEIASFTQFVANSAAHYLPSGVPIEITIDSAEGVQAFVSRDQGSKNFYTHVFGSY